jgi:hypothetical protein
MERGHFCPLGKSGGESAHSERERERADQMTGFFSCQSERGKRGKRGDRVTGTGVDNPKRAGLGNHLIELGNGRIHL